jgi:hypothetical protein
VLATEGRIRHYLINSKALPYWRVRGPNKAMLTGPELGAALRAAISKKAALYESQGHGRLTKKNVAEAFGVKPPSLQDWMNFGRIGKQHLNTLVEYFSDVVGPEHWGIGSAGFTAPGSHSEDGAYTNANVHEEVKQSPLMLRSVRLADQLVAATRTGLLDERGIAQLENDLRRYVGAAQSPQEHDEAGTFTGLAEPQRKSNHGRRTHGRKRAG